MTKLFYLENSRVYELKAKIIDIFAKDDHTCIILDQTIFYPQCGGQPADKGLIVSPNSTFSVTDVRFDEKGNAVHTGQFQSGKFAIDDEVLLQVDKKNRIDNTRLHSAGHLLDCAVAQLKLNLEPTKGFHFFSGPYVEYNGTIENESSWIEVLNKTIKELVASDLKLEEKILSIEEAQKQGLSVPTGDFLRIINFEGYPGCGCGGTHVASAGEIGQISIRKIKSKKGITKISYQIE